MYTDTDIIKLAKPRGFLIKKYHNSICNYFMLPRKDFMYTQVLFPYLKDLYKNCPGAIEKTLMKKGDFMHIINILREINSVPVIMSGMKNRVFPVEIVPKLVSIEGTYWRKIIHPYTILEYYPELFYEFTRIVELPWQLTLSYQKKKSNILMQRIPLDELINIFGKCSFSSANVWVPCSYPRKIIKMISASDFLADKLCNESEIVNKDIVIRVFSTQYLDKHADEMIKKTDKDHMWELCNQWFASIDFLKKLGKEIFKHPDLWVYNRNLTTEFLIENRNLIPLQSLRTNPYVKWSSELYRTLAIDFDLKIVMREILVKKKLIDIKLIF